MQHATTEAKSAGHRIDWGRAVAVRGGEERELCSAQLSQQINGRWTVDLQPHGK